MGLLGGITALFLVAECFVMPRLDHVINNPDMKSIAATRGLKELEGVPFYHLEQEPLRIEIVYAAHRTIRPTTADSLAAKLPCVLLTHGRAGEELPGSLWSVADSVYIGRYDDNHRPEGNRLHNPMFVYHVTLLRPRPQDAGSPAAGRVETQPEAGSGCRAAR